MPKERKKLLPYIITLLYGIRTNHSPKEATTNFSVKFVGPLPQSLGHWGPYVLHCQVKYFVNFYVRGSSVRLVKLSLSVTFRSFNLYCQEMSCVLLPC